MSIVWNKVTWYSKLLAAVFFIFVVPALTFYVGKQYENTKDVLKSFEITTVAIDHDSIEPIDSTHTTNTVSGSGIFGSVMVTKEPFKGFIAVKTTKGTLITTTKVRENGRFFLLLPPGSYELSPISSDPMPSIDPTDIAVQKNIIARVTMQLGS